MQLHQIHFIFSSSVIKLKMIKNYDNDTNKEYADINL